MKRWEMLIKFPSVTLTVHSQLLYVAHDLNLYGIIGMRVLCLKWL